MELGQALKILGLPQNFTETELRKAYYKLSKEYHPDQNGTSTEEIQKKINYAREIAKEYLKKQNGEPQYKQTYEQPQETEKFDINKYRKEKIELLTNKTSFPDYKTVVESKKIQDVIFGLTNYHMIFIMGFKDKHTKQEIDAAYTNMLDDINFEFQKIAKFFSEEYDIPKEILQEKLNYSCNVKHFYNQLLVLKEKYSKLEQIKDTLKKEEIKYQEKQGYSRLKETINEYLNETILKIRKNNYQKNEEIIENLHTRIQVLFKNYEIIEQSIEVIESFVKQIEDQNIKTQFDIIKNKWINNTKINETKDDLSNFEEVLEQYQESKDFYVNIEPIYNLLLERKTKALKDKNLMKDYHEIKNINETFDTVIELLKRGCDERKQPEFFELFKSIQFSDNELDNKILKEIKYRSRKIYIKKRIFHQSIRDGRSFFFVTDNNDDNHEIPLYRIDLTTEEELIITKEELEKQYIALDDIITSKTIAGTYRKNPNNDRMFLVVAENEDFGLYKTDDQYFICVNEFIDLVDNYGTEELDKYSIITMITEYLQERISKSKNKKR